MSAKFQENFLPMLCHILNSNTRGQILILLNINQKFKKKQIAKFISAVFLKRFHPGYIQSTLVISTSIISSNRLSRRENLVRV